MDIKGVITAIARAIVEGGKVKGTFSKILDYQAWGKKVEIEGEFEVTIALRS